MLILYSNIIQFRYNRITSITEHYSLRFCFKSGFLMFHMGSIRNKK